jgi:hypothetical protein
MGLIPIVDLTAVAVLAPVSSSTAGPTKSTPISILDYEGQGVLVVQYATASGGSPTLDVAVQAGAAANGSDSAAVKDCKGATAAITQAVATGIQMITLPLQELGKYLCISVTIGGSATFVHSATLLAQKKSKIS